MVNNKNDKENWIKLNRSLADHWIWTKEKFTKGQAWVDLLMMARWKDGKQLHRGKLYVRKRGEINCSMKWLAKRWGWDRRTVKGFLTLLESDGMLSVRCTTNDTTITIENYSVYQDKPTEECTTECTTDSTTECTTECTHKKKEKKEKKEKNISPQTPQGDCAEIINHLNSRTGTNYRANSKKTVSLIKARQNEGFTVEDFKTVIDKKCVEWMNTEWEKFLRPETLFGTKFENYLNAPVKPPSTGSKWLDLLRDTQNGKEWIKF